MDQFDLTGDVYSDVISAPGEIGTPLEDAISAPGPQERLDSCAIRAQQHLLAMYGIEIPETDLVRDAISHGEYSTLDFNGTLLDDVGNLLERNGIGVHRYEGATIAHLISELAQGHKIIVGIDANEVVASDINEVMIERAKDQIAEVPNHAVVVVNVDAHSLDVEIVDPADGKLHRIPASTFVDAWHDSNCFMVATNKSPSEFTGVCVPEEASASNFESTDSRIKILDINGDGLGDIIGFDYNGDGIIDEYFIDNDHDGIPDVGKGGFMRVGDIPGLGGLGHTSTEITDWHLTSLNQKDGGMKMNENDVMLGGLGHVAGTAEDAMPHLGSLGQRAGGLTTGGNEVSLGGLGHVSGTAEDAMPHLGSLGQRAGGLTSIQNDIKLGGLGHVSGVAEGATPHLGSLGQRAGGLAFESNEVSLGSLGHVSGATSELAFMDIDGDGKADLVGVDLDHDGKIDMIGVDTTGNGIPDQFGLDLDGDGKLDVIGLDVNGDGRPDIYGMDIDGDGIPDVYGVDLDGDGTPDAIGIDSDGDGKIDNILPMD